MALTGSAYLNDADIMGRAAVFGGPARVLFLEIFFEEQGKYSAAFR